MLVIAAKRRRSVFLPAQGPSGCARRPRASHGATRRSHVCALACAAPCSCAPFACAVKRRSSCCAAGPTTCRPARPPSATASAGASFVAPSASVTVASCERLSSGQAELDPPAEEQAGGDAMAVADLRHADAVLLRLLHPRPLLLVAEAAPVARPPVHRLRCQSVFAPGAISSAA